MIETKSLKQSLGLQLTSSLFVFLWCLIASFPIFWITIMSIKLPVDAFSSNPITVIFGPLTSQERASISLNELIILSLLIFVLYKSRLRFFIIFTESQNKAITRPPHSFFSLTTFTNKNK